MAELFKEILPSIMQTKEVCLDADNEKDYNPFMVNRALSLHNDCLFYANEINRYPHLHKMAQYQYYLGAIRSRKRNFVPWPKKNSEDDIKAIKWYFDYSTNKALEASKVLNEEQILHIQEAYKAAHS